MSSSSTDAPPPYIALQADTSPNKPINVPFQDDDTQPPHEQAHLQSWEPAESNTEPDLVKEWLSAFARRLPPVVYSEAASPRRHHYTLLFTLCLAFLQLICIAILRKYDLCTPATGTWAHFRREDCRSFVASLPSFLGGEERPSTALFLFALVAWLVATMLQHRIQRASSLQNVSVGFGCVVGGFFSVPFSAIEGRWLFPFTLVPFVVSLAMFVHALVHWCFGEKVERNKGPEYTLLQEV